MPTHEQALHISTKTKRNQGSFLNKKLSREGAASLSVTRKLCTTAHSWPGKSRTMKSFKIKENHKPHPALATDDVAQKSEHHFYNLRYVRG
jgi:hypothetical protein